MTTCFCYRRFRRPDILVPREYQIDVEIPESKLRQHGLTLQQVAEYHSPPERGVCLVTMRTPGQERLVGWRQEQTRK